MAVAFREVFSAFGVDTDGDKPRMMVPLHGTNLVALEGDPDLVLVPGKFTRISSFGFSPVDQVKGLATGLGAPRAPA